ncbi:DUF4349 domain-containing protein [Candidatus Nomurabacteria bacterium]|nr:DUF4349 domain-containing protein [Candidatus Nomurabacteria bacterium]
MTLKITLNSNRLRILIILTVSLMMLLTLISCSAVNSGLQKDENTTIKESRNATGYNNYEEAAEQDSSKTETTNASLTTRKMIFTAAMDIETLDYEKSITDFEALVEEYEGFIQDSRIESSTGINTRKSLRTAVYRVRIPSTKLSTFRKAAGDIGTITLNDLSGDDVTDSYYDTQARLEALQVQEERLLALLEKAEELKDIIDLEDRLSQLRYEIETLTGSLNKWDALVEMSTVNVEITEVASLTEPDPETFGQQISKMFTDSVNALTETLKQLVIALVAILPFLVVFGTIATAVIIPVVRSSKKKRRQREAEMEALRSGLTGKQD